MNELIAGFTNVLQNDQVLITFNHNKKKLT